MHEHKKLKECKHELKHCTHCDVVYCSKCQREWGKDTLQGLIDRKDQWDYNRITKGPIPNPVWMVQKMHKHVDDQREVI